MNDELTQFHAELRQDVELRAGAAGNYKLATFAEYAADHLIDIGELTSFDEAYHAQPRSEVHGSAGDPRDANGVLALLFAIWDDSEELQTLGTPEVERCFKRLKAFVRSARGDAWKHWEESGAGYGLASLIHESQKAIRSVRLYIVSNKKLSNRIRDFVDEDLEGVPIQHRVWDLARLKTLMDAGRERTEMVIDLAAEFGQTLPCLPASYGKDHQQAFLAVVPGEMLASLYEKWNTRLLEQNVRVFLQARGKVNKGIRNTILHDPEMFFAYNNGITATAEQVDTIEEDGGLRIHTLHNLQIVNGGQTTASIFTTGRGRNAADLSRVFVQMKLSVVQPEDVQEVVPRISEYANSQNKVSSADFFSNHPFHVRMEEISRRLMTPIDGTRIHPTRWFYERARGQHRDARSRSTTTAQRRAFDAEFPRSQVFTKTDLAKFHNVWRRSPHVVSRGAQKNFAEFATHIEAAWDKRSEDFNDHFFRQTVARAIVFRRLEKLVSSQDWYEGGYRANVVAYGIARLALAVQAEKKSVDFEAIWTRQGMSEAMEAMLLAVAELMHRVLLEPPEGVRNISEYAKREVCWKQAQLRTVQLSARFRRELIDPEQKQSDVSVARRDRRNSDEDAAIMQVVGLREADPHFWRKVHRFGRKESLLSPKDAEILQKAAMVRNAVPSGKQAVYLIRLLERLRKAGLTG